MSVLPIYTIDQPVLRKKARPVRKLDDALVTLAGDMIETMRKANGIGLAANQVGVLHRIIAIDLSAMEETKDFSPMVLINPEVYHEEGKWVMEEGCLSIPDVREDVERAEVIRVRYKDLEFNDHDEEFAGLPARVILHETDHLDGILFYDHLNALKRKLLRGRLNKIRRGEIEVNYPIVSGAMSTNRLQAQAV